MSLHTRIPFLLKQGLRNARRYKFSVLLVFQLMFIFVYPLVRGSHLEWLLHVVATFFFLTIVSLCPTSKGVAYLNLVLGMLAVVIYSIDYFIYFTDIPVPIEGMHFIWIYDVFFISLFLYFTGTLCFHMLTDKEPQIDTLAGTAAVYLMVGLTWSFAYMNLENVEPGSFRLATGSESIGYINWLFYSIGTLVSTTYGDIMPVSSYAKCFTLLESIIGALYVAIITARIVGVPFNRMNESA